MFLAGGGGRRNGACAGPKALHVRCPELAVESEVETTTARSSWPQEAAAVSSQNALSRVAHAKDHSEATKRLRQLPKFQRSKTPSYHILHSEEDHNGTHAEDHDVSTFQQLLKLSASFFALGSPTSALPPTRKLVARDEA